MPYFEEGDHKGQEKVIKDDTQELREVFATWRLRQDAMAEMLDPRSGQVDTSTPGVVQSKTQRQSLAKSEYLSNRITTGVQDVVEILGSSDPVISIPIADQTKEELAKIALVEAFCLGIFNRLDSATVQAGTDVSWRRQVNSHTVNTGKVIGLPHLYALPVGTLDVEWPLFDPYLCYHDFGVRPPRRFICEYQERPKVVRLELERERRENGDSFFAAVASELDYTGKSMKVAQYWLEDTDEKGQIVVWKGMLVNEHLVYLRKTAYKRWPILIASVSQSIGSQRRGSNGHNAQADFMRRHAEPFFAAAEHPLRLFNQAKSLEMDGLALSIRPHIFEISETGELFMREGELAPGGRSGLTPGQIVQPFQYRSETLMAQASTVTGLEQELEYVMPNALRSGQPPIPGASGYYLRQIKDSARNRIISYARAANAFYRQGFMELAQQFQDTVGNPRLELTSRGRQGEYMGRFFQHSFSKKDLPEGLMIEVESGPLLPEDEMRGLQMAQYARDLGVDDLTILDRYLHVQDPVTMRSRRKRQQIEDSPESLDLLRLRALREEVKAAEERAAKTARDKGPQSVEADQMRQEAELARYDAEVFEARILGQRPGFQQKPQAGKPNPEIQPSVERGFESEDEQMSVQGVIPSPQARAGRSPRPSLEE